MSKFGKLRLERIKLVTIEPRDRDDSSGSRSFFADAVQDGADAMFDVVRFRHGSPRERWLSKVMFVAQHGRYDARHGYALSGDFQKVATAAANLNGDPKVISMSQTVAPRLLSLAAENEIQMFNYTDLTLLEYFEGYRICDRIPIKLKTELISQEINNYRLCKKIFVYSTENRDCLISRYGIAPDKIYVVGRGVNLERDTLADIRRAREGREAKARLELLFVGVDFERKGLRSLVEAIDGLQPEQRQEVTLNVVGPAITELPVRSYLRPHGFISRSVGMKKITELFSRADLGVLLSGAEGLPGFLWECLACGIPAVTTDLPATKQALAGHAVRFVGRESKVEDCRLILSDLLCVADLNRLTEQAIADRNLFGWDRVANIVLKEISHP